MKHILTLLSVLFPVLLYSQVIISPGRTDTINFTHVLFELPSHTGVSTYELLVNEKDTDDTIKITAKGPRILLTYGIVFGKKYNWLYKCYNKKGKNIFTSSVSQLHIMGQAMGDTAQYRYAVSVYNDHKAKDGLVLLDMGVIIDRRGVPVWTFPPGKFGAVRSFEMTPEGNLTFLWNGSAYETDLRGNIIWQAPDTIAGMGKAEYHHEFKKMDNGNYLCIVSFRSVNSRVKQYSVVMEIHPGGNPVWAIDEEQWHDTGSSGKSPHMNAACYDTKSKELFISNRDLNAITKVDVPTGRIEYSIGYNYQNKAPHYSQDFFNAQHSISILQNGDMLLFNNNTLKRNAASSIVVLSQPKGNRTPVKKWEYIFNFDNTVYNKVGKQGGVTQLPGGNFLICMGANSKIVEVNKAREIVWEADAQQYNNATLLFVPVATGYRASFTTSLYPGSGK